MSMCMTPTPGRSAGRALTLQYREKVQEWADFLVVTVTDRLELVSTFTPSK